MSVTLHLGDCVEVMRGMDAQSVDLILTSPPYDNLRKYGSGSAFDFPGVAGECKRLLKPGGVLVWVVGDETKDGSESGTSFRQALHFKEIGLRLHDTMIYRKLNYVPLTHRRYEQAFEFMFVLSLGRPAKFSPLMKPCKLAGKTINGSFHYLDGEKLSPVRGTGKQYKASKIIDNVWSYGVGGKGATGHPAPFPLQLAIDHILSWTNPGDTVLDCFAGSGTTLEACIRTDRNGIGIEKDPGYLEIARKRSAAARNDRRLFAAESA